MAQCPSCGDPGFVNDRTKGSHEAACLEDRCRIVVFEVGDDA